MTNENLKVGDVLKHLGITYSNMAKEQYPSSDDCENVYVAINLIKSQQSNIELLESAIRDAAEYHRGYVEKLKISDPERSLRQQDRVNYFMSILGNEK